MCENLNKKYKIYSEAFPPNEKGERQQLLSLSSSHAILNGININPEKIIYKPLTKNNLIEVKKLHKEWFPIDYDDNYFEAIFQNDCYHYFTIGAFYNIEKSANTPKKEIILGLALCEWDSISDYFIEHTNSGTIEIINNNININEKVQACLKCQMYRCVYIMTIGVLDGCRQMNIGSHIIDNIFKIAVNDELCFAIYLDVICYNKTAIRFYEKNNFKKVKENKDYYEFDGKKFDGYVYLRLITRNEKDNYTENHRSCLSRFINRFIINPINYIREIILCSFLKKCVRKRINSN